MHSLILRILLYASELNCIFKENTRNPNKQSQKWWELRRCIPICTTLVPWDTFHLVKEGDPTRKQKRKEQCRGKSIDWEGRKIHERNRTIWDELRGRGTKARCSYGEWIWKLIGCLRVGVDCVFFLQIYQVFFKDLGFWINTEMGRTASEIFLYCGIELGEEERCCSSSRSKARWRRK